MVFAKPTWQSAGSLTGATLASGVTASSLTSLGIISGNLTVASGELRLTNDNPIQWGTSATANIRGEDGDGSHIAFATGAEEVMRLDLAGSLYIGDTTNANMTIGLTINQGCFDNQIFALKSSDVVSGLIDVVLSPHDVETDDFFTISKAGANGTAHIQSIAQVEYANGLIIDTYAGPPNDTDDSSSTGAINMFVAQHNGSNVLVDMDAGRNALAVGEINSSGARLARMILKADDGELHLGNSTLASALDDEDDRQIIRALQREGSSSGIIDSEWDNPFYDYDKLHELGLAGEKDEEGFFLFPLQSRLHAHEGAMWQNYTEIRGMQEKLGVLESKLLAIEGVK